MEKLQVYEIEKRLFFILITNIAVKADNKCYKNKSRAQKDQHPHTHTGTHMCAGRTSYRMLDELTIESSMLTITLFRKSVETIWHHGSLYQSIESSILALNRIWRS